jgi:hypothetical protein
MTAADEDRREEAKERRLERLRHLHAQAIELTNATAAFEHAALAPPMLLNGGALVAVLALLGTENFGALAGHPLSVIAIRDRLRNGFPCGSDCDSRYPCGHERREAAWSRSSGRPSAIRPI